MSIVRTPASETCAGRNADDGFTLIEVVVSFAILAIVAIATVSTLTTGTRLTTINTDRVAAANLAQQYIERARAENPSDLGALVSSVDGNGNAGSAVTIGNHNFTVTMSNSATCQPVNSMASVSVYMTHVQVVVTWVTTGGGGNVTTDTVISC